MERPTRLELATSTLARWRSTRRATAAHSICFCRSVVRRRWLLYRTLRQLSTTKLHFFKKECLLTLVRSFYFVCSTTSPLFTSFRTAVCTSKIQLLSISQTIIIKRTLCQTESCTRAGAASIYRKEKGIASKKELTQCIRSLKRSR